MSEFPIPCLGDGTAPTTTLLRTEDEPRLEVPLFRFEGAGPPVLLIHGASAWSGSYVAPASESLVDLLLKEGRDVWLLDWRGGRNTLKRYGGAEFAALFSFERIAERDVLSAVAHIAELRGVGGKLAPVDLIGHCVGGALTALAIAQRVREVHPIRRVVLSTLGLFSRQAWDGVLKAGDLMLERVLTEQPDRTTVRPDPGAAGWPRAMEAGWNLWPAGILPPGKARDDVFTRLAFMFGRIAMWNRLHESMRSEEVMLAQFGRMHLQTYIQCGQSVRRGFLAPFDAPEGPTGVKDEDRAARRFLDRGQFADVEITLITGAENNLWHRDSVDRMADWLRTIPRDPAWLAGLADRPPCVKHIVEGYGHQDLLWGAKDRQGAVLGLYLAGIA